MMLEIPELTEMARQFDAHHGEVKEFFGETDKTLKGVNARLGDIEQKMARRRSYGGGSGEPAGSLGAELVAHPDFGHIKALANSRGKVTLELKTTTVTSAVGVGAALVAPDFRPDAVLIARRRFFVRDLVSPGSTVGNAITYPRQTLRDLNAAVVSEGVRKPQSGITFDIETAPVRTIAHWTKTSRQILEDAPQLQSILDSEMRYGLNLAEEQELIFGDGTGVHVLGVVPQSTAYDTSRNGTFPLENRFDTLAHALTQSEVALLPATGIVMNINDLSALKGIKSTIGQYIAEGGPFGPPITSIWGRPVVGTPVIPVGLFLVGAFFDGAQIFDRQGASVLVSTENEDDFVTNKATILCEERLAFTVRRPQAFIYGAFP
jgi:HK97 family phage major capsid protein